MTRRRDMTLVQFADACARRGIRVAYGIVWTGPKHSVGHMVDLSAGNRRRTLAHLIADHDRRCTEAAEATS